MVEVELKRVGKTYPGGIRAVNDLSLTVAPGELLVLVGPSGCGKTTTLRLIAGLESPTRGTIRLAGKDVTAVPPWRRGVSLAFQRPALYPHRSVAANLALGLGLAEGPGWLTWLGSWLLPGLGRRRRAWRSERDSRVRETAELLGLQEVLHRRPGELSGGQQQRVALGRALVRRPAVLLLDEPLSNLDARLRLELRRELLLLHRALPATIVYVTHDPAEAMTLGDRVAVLHGGVLQQVGTPREVYDGPRNRFVAGFVGWPPMSFLDGQVVLEAGRLCFRGGGAALPLPADRADWLAFAGRPVVLGIRPEHVQLREAGAGDRPGASLDMAVSLAEPQGAFSLVTCEQGGWRLAALERGTPRLVEGQRVTAVLALDRAHLFDRAGNRTG